MDSIKPEMCIMKVTPKLASTWLALNTHNRNIRRRDVLKYAADMAAGNWIWTGEAIKFNTEGKLSDGQHRLLAIVESGVTLELLVIKGLSPEAQERLDQGIGRKFHDVLALRGEVNAQLLAAILRRVYEWEQAGPASGNRLGERGPYAPSTAQLLAALEVHPELRDITVRANAIGKHRAVTAAGSTIGLLIWLFDRLGEEAQEDCRYFFDRVCDGQGLIEGDPIYALRVTYDQMAGGIRRKSRERISQTYAAAITIKAWNGYREGQKVYQLRWRQGGANPEDFPVPR